jgi:putative DNA primase/helicase
VIVVADLARALGNARLEGAEWRCDCPVCGSRNLTISKPGEVLLVRCWNGCAGAAVLAELRRRGLYGAPNGNGRAGTRAEPGTRAAEDDPSAKAKAEVRRNNALDIWRNSLPAPDTMAQTYLCSRLLIQEVPPALRYTPAIRHSASGVKAPAMIGLVEHQKTGAVGIHIVFLNPLDASARFVGTPRKISIGPIKGGAVRLAPAGPVLAIAEGIEDAMAFTQHTRIPCWAAISETGIRNFVPPPPAETPEIVLVEDQDTNGDGQRAVATAARRFAKTGYRIRIARPTVGKDINEALLTLGLHESLCSLEDYVEEEPAAEADLTDDGIATTFVDVQVENLRYVDRWGDWMLWRETCWKADDTLEVYSLSRAVCRFVAAAQTTAKLTAILASAKTVHAVVSLARSDRRIAKTVDVWDADNLLFNTPGDDG